MEPQRYANEKEGNLLVELIEKYKDIIMDKRTDHTMIGKKAETWDRITHLYNVAAVGPTKTRQQLKRMWEHHKSKAKKKYNAERRQCMKTGGGPPKKEADDDSTSNVLAIISQELETLESSFDCDALEVSNDRGTVVLTIPPPCNSPTASSSTNIPPSFEASATPLTSKTDPRPTTTCQPVRHGNKRMRSLSYQDNCFEQSLQLKKEEHDIYLENLKAERECLKIEKEIKLLKLEVMEEKFKNQKMLGQLLQGWVEKGIVIRHVNE